MRDRRGSGAGFSSPMLMFGSPPPPSPPPKDAVSKTESESDLRGRKGPLKMKCWPRARIGLCVCVYACMCAKEWVYALVCVGEAGGGRGVCVYAWWVKWMSAYERESEREKGRT